MEVTIKIEGDGISITKTTTLVKAGQIISFLASDSVPSTYDGGTNQTMPMLKPFKTNIHPKEIILESEAKTYPQKIAAIALSLEERGQNSFAPDEIRVALKKMGDEPKNFSRDLRVAMNDLLYIVCDDSNPDQCTLTDRGREAVQEKFKGQSANPAKIGSTTKRASPAGIRSEVDALDNSVTLDSHPDYHNLSTKGEKILWLLAFASAANISGGLSTGEIELMSSRRQERIESKNITALNSSNHKKGFAKKNQKTGLIELEKRGSDFIKQPKLNEQLA